MAEIHCPMCGKLNPEDRENCEFCQARLKPLQVFPPSGVEAHISQTEGSPPDEEIPEWLRSIRSPEDPQEPSEKDEVPFEWGPEEEDEASPPDWLRSLRPSEAQQPPAYGSVDEGGEEPPPLSPFLADSESDRELSGQAEEGAAAAEEEPAATAPRDQPHAAGEPEWLRRIRARRHEETAGDEEGSSGAASFDALDRDSGTPDDPFSEQLPAWLAQEERDPTDEQSTADARRSETDSEQPFDDLPEWLKEAGEGTGAGEPSTGSPSWLEPDVNRKPPNLPSTSPGAASPFTDDPESQEELASLFDSDVPEWLSSTEPKENAAETSGESGDESGTDLVPADLPTWLQAMRPVESAAASVPSWNEETDEAASAGPLAGLRGVLPAEPEISRTQKPPVTPSKLQLTEAQKAQAALLEELIQSEVESKPPPARPIISSQHILRIGMAIILILAVLWGLFGNGQAVPPPAPDSGTAAAHRVIDAISTGAPVLVAVDYEPGFMAELDTAGSAVLGHLVRRGAYLTLVSTLPTGPAQGERLLDTLIPRGGLPANSYANLGFIPGGPTGLQSFGRSPRLVLPYTLEGSPAWSSGPLGNIQALADFSLAVVITENPETVRAWVEQVQPQLGNSPLVMVVSAQAEPLAQPYIGAGSNQIQGLVAGLSGGAGYDSLASGSGPAGLYWNAFGLAALAAAGLILIGAIIHAASALWRAQRTGRQAGKEQA